MDEQREAFERALAEAMMAPAVRRRKLLFWGFRQTLLAALAWTFWEHTWMRWVFWTGMVLALVHLAMILLMPAQLRRMRRRGDAALAQLDRSREESEKEHGA